MEDEKMMGGGLSPTEDATPEIQSLADKVKDEAEVKTGKNFDKYVAISFRRQVVAGINYFIKVNIGGGDCVHLRVFQPLPCDGEKLELSEVQYPKTLQDPIVYF